MAARPLRASAYRPRSGYARCRALFLTDAGGLPDDRGPRLRDELSARAASASARSGVVVHAVCCTLAVSDESVRYESDCRPSARAPRRTTARGREGSAERSRPRPDRCESHGNVFAWRTALAAVESIFRRDEGAQRFTEKSDVDSS